MDIEPLVGKKLFPVDDENNDDKAAECEAAGSCQYIGRGPGLEKADQPRQGHAGDITVAGEALHACSGCIFDRFDIGVTVVEGRHLALQQDLAAGRLNTFPEPLPHHARPEPGIVKLLDEAFCLLAAEKGIGDSHQKRQPLYALSGPVRSYLMAGNAPDLFRVGLEKCFVEPFPEPVNDPLLEVVLPGFWEETGSAVA